MSEEIWIDMEMPFLKVDFTGTVSKTTPASGMAFTVMKMIELGHSLGRGTTLGQAMMVLSIPSDLLPLIIRQLEQFAAGGMVTLPVNKLTLKTDVNRIVINESGDNMLKTFVMATDEEEFEKTMVYYPGRKSKYELPGSISRTRSGRVKFDPDVQRDAIKFIKAHPGDFDLDPEGSVSSVRFDMKDSDAGYFFQKVNVVFDEGMGVFSHSNRSAIDPVFFSATYDGSDILKKLPADLFETMVPFKVDRWTDSVPEDVSGYLLPRDLVLSGGLFFYGPALTSVEMANSSRLPADAGCDAISITSRSNGRRFWFVRKDVSFEGVEGTRQMKLVAYRNMTYDEIEDAVNGIVAGLRINYAAELAALNRTASALRSETLFTDRIIAEVQDGDVDGLKKVLSSIGKLENRFWSGSMASVLEKMLCRWVENGVPMDVVSAAFAVCRNAYSCDGTTLVVAMESEYGYARVADWALSNEVESGTLGPDALAPVILDVMEGRTEGSFSSPVFKAAVKVCESLRIQADELGIHDAGSYELDLSSIDDVRKASVLDANTACASALKVVLEAAPSVKDLPGYVAFEKPWLVFSAVSSALKSKKKFAERSKFVAEENALILCINLVSRLTSQLSLITGEQSDPRSQISLLKESGDVSDELSSSLYSLLDEADDIMHHDVLRQIPAEKKAEWINAVFETLKIRPKV